MYICTIYFNGVSRLRNAPGNELPHLLNDAKAKEWCVTKTASLLYVSKVKNTKYLRRAVAYKESMLYLLALTQ